MELNRLRVMINNRQIAVGGLLMFEGASAAEIMCRAGYDFLIFDVQHEAFDVPRIEALINAVALSPCAVFARVHPGRPDEWEKILDLGAHGVMVPMVNTPDDAWRAVRACRYAPVGTRSIGGTRNLLVRGGDYFDAANDDVVCIIQIEHRSALDRLDEIFEVPGIDAIFPGPVDLARSMGLPATYAAIGDPAPPVREALDSIEAAAARHDIPVIVIAETPDQVRGALARGHRLLAYQSDFHILLRAATAHVGDVRTIIGETRVPGSRR